LEDEFAIFMPSALLAEAELACRYLSLSPSKPNRLGEVDVSINASFGIAEAKINGDCDDVLKAADKALYRENSCVEEPLWFLA
jgi:GGDEF domain-containing protein